MKVTITVTATVKFSLIINKNKIIANQIAAHKTRRTLKIFLTIISDPIKNKTNITLNKKKKILETIN